MDGAILGHPARMNGVRPNYADVCPQMARDTFGPTWIADIKNPADTGFVRCSWKLRDFNLVEAAGVEPASASTLPLALHA
jgi:hypothetical protein